MEAKTILRLIKDDIADLEGIAGEFVLESLPSSDEVDLAIVRAKAILKELELLHKYTTAVEDSLKDINRTEIPTIEVSVQDHIDREPFELFNREPYIKNEVTETIQDQDQYEPIVNVQDVELNSIEPEKIEESPDSELTALVSEEEVVVPEKPLETIPEIIDEQPDNIDDGVVVLKESISDDVIPEEENLMAVNISDNKVEILVEEVEEAQKTLGETLVDSHQVVNDILSQEKIESEYQIIPINSIWDGIGINDRFLFIRELFANSSAKFENTIGTLDKLNSIQEAVEYLKMNFKWNKTEASQKFLVLVKRRFTK